MASDKRRFLLTIIEESMPFDGAEEDIEYFKAMDDVPSSLGDVVSALEPCYETSSAPVRTADDLWGNEWAVTEPSADYRSGVTESRSVHVKTLNGGLLKPETLFRLFRLAKLV